jgi:hypothetical protein
MEFFMTCGICGDRLRVREGRGLMNRIKMLIHIEKCHPEHIEEFREALRARTDETVDAIAVSAQAA